MPQMGESIAEGTVSKWLKQVGDPVERDEPILEISTDKVDAEIPSPESGTLVEVRIQEGETVEIGTVVAYIDTEAGAAITPTAGDATAPTPVTDTDDPISPPAESRPDAGPSASAPATAEERIQTRSTPVVRKIAAEHGISIADVVGSGQSGRVTKRDILDFIENGRAKTSTAASATNRLAGRTAGPPAAPVGSGSSSELWGAFYSEVQHPEFPVREGDHVEPMDKIRRLTAEHMVLAKRVAPHVHSFIEIDFSLVDHHRAAHKGEWAAQGVRVSFTAFVVWACSRLLRKYPPINGTVSGNNIIHRGSVNIGMAVDLDPGLIVPVIHDTDELGLVGIGKKIIDLADRARSRRLAPSEIQGATFSITNPGVLGTLVGMPIIPKGTAAILGIGAIEKRAVVVEDPLTGTDAVAIRKRAFFSLAYDHRLVDGAVAARFLSDLKALLEDFPEDA
ncbi:MAG: 2-oxo acid dehydrogenase subunit E2 [Gemmatimonadetes bacterium]|nr:2-oxo acid dehydrogenase subunit E2 [Gemmatimonadota bacterium]